MRPMLKIAADAARQAGDMIARATQRPHEIKVQSKGQHDYVTQIDYAAERIILNTLTEHYPDHCYLSEEQGETIGKATDHQWIIDPLDGTRNFIMGLPMFAVSIAKRYRGRVEHAVIYNPMTQDIYTASLGEGAQHNGKRMRVSDRKTLQGATFSAGITRVNDNLTAQLATFSDLHQKCHLRQMGSTALELASVASGAIDFLWHFDCPIWDIAAGALLIREAGGMIMEPNGGVDYLQSGNILAGNAKTSREILKTLQQHF